jgi:hypothetical protein
VRNPHLTRVKLSSRVLKLALRKNAVLLKLGTTVRGLASPIAEPLFLADKNELSVLASPAGFRGAGELCRELGSTSYSAKISLTKKKVLRLRFGKVRAAN